MEARHPTSHAMTDNTEKPQDDLPTPYLLKPGNNAFILKLRNRLEEYEAQEYVLTLFKELDNAQGDGPEFGAELAIDTEDGIYFLYYNGEEGIEIDEDDFETDALRDQYCKKVAGELEGMTQWMNSYSGVEDSEKWFERGLVDELNEVSWRKSERMEAVAKAMNDRGWDGSGFMAALRAQEIEKDTQPAAGAARRKPGL